ncbi:nuclear valosin-containing protein-like [Pristis pectinata]|uniref:nuclear valosin-containing protein-like n=1 Tax=Pristis pectinata TaxID=685728 RepID=UPI00223CE196|nr:nuclear valosin-containing protein-like [Pristis pectinata]XP_051880315.1 nuclear valosin-containing protein-like [Pristis pectinata]XP_051880316.1 nuclear valosin-containing protein-like [Pristis pectinata]
MKTRSPLVDARLKHRVKQYLSNSNSRYVDIGVLAADLQRQYSMDYGRRKRNVFRIQVEKVYQLISSKALDYEEEHLAKRARQSHDDHGSEVIIDSSDSEDYPEYPTTNHMNSSLLSLYRGTDGDPSPAPRKVPEGSSTPGQAARRAEGLERTPGGTEVSPGGWFIDRAPGTVPTDEETPHGSQGAGRSGPERPKRSGRRRGRRREQEPPRGADGTGETAVPDRTGGKRGFHVQQSPLTFEDVGGSSETLKEVCRLLVHLRHPEVYERLGVQPPRGFLLHGPPGCGKSLLAQAIAGELDLPLLRVAATEMVSGVSGESEHQLRQLFEEAVLQAPCIVFIDEIDAISPKREVASKDMERRIVAQLLACMDDLNALDASTQVLVVGATNRPDALDPALRRAGRFDREICLGIPSEGAREQILRTLCRKLRLPEPFDFRELARLTPGYVGADLMALCREAAMNAVNRILNRRQEVVSQGPDAGDPSSGQRQESELVELQRLRAVLRDPAPLPLQELQDLQMEMTDFTSSLSAVQPSAKREGFATVPDVSWADIGALQEIREELTMAILAPLRHPEQFQVLGLSNPAGVLLAGPPGCGKTLLAKAVANESGLNFISVKGPELLNMYVGESERAVRQVFQRARNSAPCVIFFDELDALCPRRSEHESGASVRVVNQLLTEMDGLQARRQVFIMAATNRPDIIDPAVLRPGRLDKTLYVGLPPAPDRLAILQTLTKGGTRPPLDPDVDLSAIAGDPRCDCFTGADLSALLREASINALRQQLSEPEPASRLSLRVTRQHFEAALEKVKPSVSRKDQLMYEQLRRTLSQ